MANFWENLFRGSKLDKEGKERLAKLQSCPQNKMIPRVPRAGSIAKGSVMTHNGLLLGKQGLAEDWSLIIHNKGVLEPQHEYAFSQIAQVMGAAPTMMDIGGRHGFYSMWLKMLRPGARCIMIEPDRNILKQGEKNFERNKLLSQSMAAYISRKAGRVVDDIPVKTLTDISSFLKADYISIMHADIQGYELELIEGGEPLLKDRGVDYILLSTHADALHKDCREYLEYMRYKTLADIAPSQSFCPDGLLLMRRRELKGVEEIPLQPYTPSAQ